MRKLLIYLKPYKIILTAAILLMTGQGIANLYLPDLNANIINNGVLQGDIAYITRMGLFMLLIAVLVMGAAVLAFACNARISAGFGRDIRGSIFRKIESFSRHDMELFGTPSLITRSTNDVLQVQQIVQMGLSVMILTPINCLGGIIMALRQDPQLSRILFVTLPAMIIGTYLFLRIAIPLFTAMQQRLDKVNRVAREKLSGVRVIRAFVKVKYEEKRFDSASREWLKTGLSVQYLMAVMMPLIVITFQLTSVAIIWFGSLRIDGGLMPFGNLSAVLMYAMQIMLSITMGTTVFMMLPRAMASAKRINAVLLTDPVLKDEPDPARLPALSLSFENVTFAYPGAKNPALKDISFSALPGQTVAVIGSTGCGKSALVNLIPRFYDVTSGRILIGGLDIRRLSQEDLNRRIGFVSQEPLLFSGDIAANIRFGKKDATEEEIWQALRVAQAEDFVKAKKEGLFTPVSQGGINFSGGQKQRLCIARALIRRPDIYIFDDSFSALDSKTDAKLHRALARETSKAITLIVAQRVGTVMNADLIIVLENGRIAGLGQHQELLESCRSYKEIVDSQMMSV
ncbi:MAG: ABC transporter ATP-binding protein/permease [Clostridiales bacterium]|nr:ABC transporter ATP-binding protein/permease [Clostridiales bacterium]